MIKILIALYSCMVAAAEYSKDSASIFDVPNVGGRVLRRGGGSRSGSRSSYRSYSSRSSGGSYGSAGYIVDIVGVFLYGAIFSWGILYCVDVFCLQSRIKKAVKKVCPCCKCLEIEGGNTVQPD